MSLFHDFSNVSTATVLILSLSAYPQEVDNPDTQKTDLKLDNTLYSEFVEPTETDLMPSEVVLPVEKEEPLEVPSLQFFFGFDESELSVRHEQQVKDVAEYLIKSGDTFEIRGCASKDGKNDGNFFLSNRRANSLLNSLEEAGVPVTRYMYVEDKNGNEIIGQDRDTYGEGEKCPSLVDGVKDTQIESRRATVILNPTYPVYEEPKYDGPPVSIFDLLKKIM